jgi:hypothetical protein
MHHPRQRGRRRSRTATTLAHQTRPLGQCLQTWKDCLACPRFAARAPPSSTSDAIPPPLGPRPKRLVFCSLNDVNCRDLNDRTTKRTRSDPLCVPLATPPGPGEVVGRGGVEPPTSRLSGVRSNHLSYRPGLSTLWGQPQAGRSHSWPCLRCAPRFGGFAVKTSWWSLSRGTRATKTR